MISAAYGSPARGSISAADHVVVAGIDTVDVTAVDTDLVGHFYYGDNTSVISDMFLVMTQGLPPAQRPRLRPAGRAPQAFWRFVP